MCQGVKLWCRDKSIVYNSILLVSFLFQSICFFVFWIIIHGNEQQYVSFVILITLTLPISIIFLFSSMVANCCMKRSYTAMPSSKQKKLQQEEIHHEFEDVSLSYDSADEQTDEHQDLEEMVMERPVVPLPKREKKENGDTSVSKKEPQSESKRTTQKETSSTLSTTATSETTTTSATESTTPGTKTLTEPNPILAELSVMIATPPDPPVASA